MSSNLLSGLSSPGGSLDVSSLAFLAAPLASVLPLAPSVLIKGGVALAFVAAATFVHYRGKVRHRFFRQLFDHSTFMAPYNALVYLFSRVPNRPVLQVEALPRLEKLRKNWEVIAEEARSLYDQGGIGEAQGYVDLAFNSFFRRGWRRFFLKWYSDFLPSARRECPRTVELLREMPEINAAMFALLAPKSNLVRHRDPFAGSLRYHLGLQTPNDDRCYIVIDGERRSWRDGEGLLFDETYIHHAENETDVPRVILFCDVERPLKTVFMRLLNRLVSRYFMRGSLTRNEAGERIGLMNRIFSGLYRIRLVGKALKRWHKPTYYVVKYLLFGTILWLIFF